MNTKSKIIIAAVAAVGLGLAGWAFLGRGQEESYELFTSTITRGTVRNAVESTGKLDAMVRVDVGSQVTGQVQELYASFNSIVREGQIIAQLDPRNYQAQVRNAEANLSSARSRIATSRADRLNAEAGLASARANLDSVQKELVQAETSLRRSEALYADGLVSETDLENVTIQLELARARLTQQEAALQQAEVQIVSRDASIVQAEASLEQAEADLEEAQLNLGYTTIRSPVDGVVISREVDVGQTVSASTSAPTLFVIANDLARMQVQASIDEADIGLLGQNKPVDFTVDAYPDDTFVGQIGEIRLNASTTQNVVTYGVIITFDNPDMKLKPGMTAYLTITIAERGDALMVPNAALRYQPPTTPDAPVGGAEAPFTQTALARPVPVGSAISASPRPGSTAVNGPAEGSGAGFAEVFVNTEDGRNSGVGVSPSVAAGIRPGAASMPGQLWDTGEMLQFQAAPPDPPRRGSVWVIDDSGLPQWREVMVGITDGSVSEVVSGDLAEGEVVVISDSLVRAEEEEASTRASRGGFMMGGGR